jgi:hypothetical protein
MKKWEYQVMKVQVGRLLGPKVDADELVGALDELGAEGWELVSAIDTTIHKGSSDEIVLFLKRPLG